VEVLVEDTARLRIVPTLLHALKGQHDTVLVNTNVTQIWFSKMSVTTEDEPWGSEEAIN
jgi:hypothetical protein